MWVSRVVIGMLSIGLAILSSSVCLGQDYPNKPIRIVTSAAGGGGDFDARQFAPAVSTALGQPMVIENRGSALLIGDVVAKAPPDGYTLLLTGSGLWIGPLLQKVGFDAVKDFAPISLVERTVNIIAVHPSVPVKSVKELIALAKARPGEINIASTGIGGSTHLAGELFRSMAGINIVHIPYKGLAPAMTALISGEVHMLIIDGGLVVPHLKSGKVKALAVTSAEPSTLFPSLPTAAATGLPGYETVGMTGIWAPAKTPTPIINRLNQEIVRVIKTPEMTQRFFNAGIEVIGSSPEAFATTIREDVARMSKVVREANIKIN